MKTVKEILTENRDSIISSMKWSFKIWKKEDIKKEMINYLAWAEKNPEIIYQADSARNTKTLLKNSLALMKRDMNRDIIEARENEKRQKNIEIYGVAKPKLSDVMSKINDYEEEKGRKYDPIKKDWIKK